MYMQLRLLGSTFFYIKCTELQGCILIGHYLLTDAQLTSWKICFEFSVSSKMAGSFKNVDENILERASEGI